MVIIEIDDKSPQAQKVIEMLNTFDFVKIKKNQKESKLPSKSVYNPLFVKKVNRRAENANKGGVKELTQDYKNKLFGK